MNDDILALYVVYEELEMGKLKHIQIGTWEELERANWLGLEYGVCSLDNWRNRDENTIA